MATVVLDRDDMRRTLVRIAHEIVEKNPDGAVALVGIHRRGAVLAERLQALTSELLEPAVPLGDVDISFYRDDLAIRPSAPVVHATHLEFPVDGRTIVIVDDVLYTGRTVRAAIDAIFDYGRPARVQLAVLVDRGHRELPIRPDYVGKNIPTSQEERVYVCVEEIDGDDEVTIGPAPTDRRTTKAAWRHERIGRHLLSIDDLDRAGDRADPRPRRVLRRGLGPRDQEGPGAARPDDRQPLLRVEHPHQLELRARGQAAERRRGLDPLAGLQRRQGRVAQGHRADAVGVRPGGDRDPLAARRRGRAGRAAGRPRR